LCTRKDQRGSSVTLAARLTVETICQWLCWSTYRVAALLNPLRARGSDQAALGTRRGFRP